MKNYLKRFVYVTFYLLASLSSWAQGAIITAPSVGSYIQVGGIAYKVTSDDPKTVAVTYKYNSVPLLNVQQTYTGSVVIPETIIVSAGSSSWTYTVTGIDDDAFQYGSGMTELTIPASITKISGSAFTNATGLKKLTFLEGDPLSLDWYYGTVGFDNCPIEVLNLYRELKASNVYPNFKYASTIHFGSMVTRIGNKMFYENETLERLVIPGNITSIGLGAFNTCSKLNVVIFEHGSTKLELTYNNVYTYQNSFNFDNLDSLYLNRELKHENQCIELSKVKHLVIGNDVTKICENGFKNSSVLKSVQIGSNVTSIGDYAFYGCSNISHIETFCTVPFKIVKRVFANETYSNATLIVPAGTVKNYQATEAWNQFANIIPTALLVTLTANEGGSVTLGDIVVTNETKTQEVKPNSVLTFEITPDETHFLTSVTVNGEDMTAQVVNGQLTPSDLSEDLEIVATFTAKPFYTVSATATTGGTATVGSTNVMWGNGTTVTLTPNEGHELKSVTVNNVDKTSEVVEGVLTLSDIKENKTVMATFQKLRFAVTVSECENGSISLSANEVEWDASATATFTPATHYDVATVSVNGEDCTAQLSNNQLTIANIRQAINVGATFQLQSFTVSETHNAGGSVSLSAGTAQWGSSVTVTITPDDEHFLESITVNGADVTDDVVDNEYTITVEGTTAVVVTFVEKPYYSVTATSSAGGTATVGSASVMWGRSTTVTLTPDESYELKSITVNEMDMTDDVVDGVLTISDIRENTAIVATFGIITETITMATSSGSPREMKGYSSNKGLDFTHVSEVKAYIASFFTQDHTTYLTRIYVVPPHTGIVLRTTNPGVTIDVPITNEDVYIANLLMPAVDNVTVKPTETIDGVDYRNLMVGKLNGTNTMGFVEFSSQVVRSNNCYLLVPQTFYNSTVSARSMGGLNVVFDDDEESTGIQTVEDYQEQERDSTYDLLGRPATATKKGLVIKNGKLIFIKP